MLNNQGFYIKEMQITENIRGELITSYWYIISTMQVAILHHTMHRSFEFDIQGVSFNC